MKGKQAILAVVIVAVLINMFCSCSNDEYGQKVEGNYLSSASLATINDIYGQWIDCNQDATVTFIEDNTWEYEYSSTLNHYGSQILTGTYAFENSYMTFTGIFPYGDLIKTDHKNLVKIYTMQSDGYKSYYLYIDNVEFYRLKKIQ